MNSKRILLVIGGGIAAYKCLDLIRRFRERGAVVRTVMTAASQHFITPLAVGALSGERVLTDLFSLDDEREIGHIRLARDTDAIVVAPATADLMARMAGGHAGDLATAVLLATDKPVLVAPAMNPRMWMHPATRRNVVLLRTDGVQFVGPNTGEMAERNEAGEGRMAEPLEILSAVEKLLGGGHDAAGDVPAAPRAALAGRHVLVTSGPTHEPIDPVRYIANRSSGRQGHAIAAAAAAAGARVTLISGPVELPDPSNVATIHVTTAAQMLAAVQDALPADVGVFVAAVADWRVAEASEQKIKKGSGAAPTLTLTENPDILRTVAKGHGRPSLVVGFAAETEHVVDHARKKRRAKGADWIVANDVSPSTGIMGGERNAVQLITAEGVEAWPDMDKSAVAERLVARIADHLALTRADV